MSQTCDTDVRDSGQGGRYNLSISSTQSVSLMRPGWATSGWMIAVILKANTAPSCDTNKLFVNTLFYTCDLLS